MKQAQHNRINQTQNTRGLRRTLVKEPEEISGDIQDPDLRRFMQEINRPRVEPHCLLSWRQIKNRG